MNPWEMNRELLPKKNWHENISELLSEKLVGCGEAGINLIGLLEKETLWVVVRVGGKANWSNSLLPIVRGVIYVVSTRTFEIDLIFQICTSRVRQTWCGMQAIFLIPFFQVMRDTSKPKKGGWGKVKKWPAWRGKVCTVPIKLNSPSDYQKLKRIND